MFVFSVACTIALPVIADFPDAELELVDGRSIHGRIIAVQPMIEVKTTDGDVLTFAWPELLSLTPDSSTSGPAETTRARGLHFVLADGSSFAARISHARDADFSIEIRPGIGGALTIDAIVAITNDDAPSEARQRFTDELAARERNGSETTSAGDLAVLAGKDKTLALSGSLQSIGPEQVVFTWNNRDVPLPWPRLAGVLRAAPAPRTAMALLHTRGGDTYAGRIVAGDAGGLSLRSSIFDNLSLPWPDIDRVEIRSDRMIFLSELRPLRYEFEPLFGLRWNYAVDRSLAGDSIRLGGRQLARGISMHSRARLSYLIDGRASQFAALAGILDDRGPYGCVTMQVLGDGRVLWEAREIRGGEAPRDVLVNVAGVRELILVVDYDADLDIADHACWGMARLIH